MSERDALYAAVLAAPADDLPRLVFADWCDDAGDGDRAEFIRVQVELARLDAADVRRVSLKARERELLVANRRQWKVQGVRGGQGFVRGFVETWDGTADWLLAAAGRLFEQAPVREVRVRNADALVEPLAALPELARVAALDLSGNTLAARDRLGRLLSRGLFRRLRSLTVGNNRLFAEDLPQLINSPVAGQLTALDLSGNPLGDEGVEALAATEAFPALWELTLRNNEQLFDDSVTEVGADALAGTRQYPRLRELDLSGHHIGDRGVTHLNSPLHRRLAVLRLAQNDLGRTGSGWAAWLAGTVPPVPRLIDLSGRRNHVRAADVPHLVGWDQLAAGVRLDLRRCTMTAAVHATLAGSPHAANILLDSHPPEEPT